MMDINYKDLKTSVLIVVISTYALILLYMTAYPALSVCGMDGCTKYNAGTGFGIFSSFSFIAGLVYYFSKNKFEMKSFIALLLLFIGVTVISLFSMAILNVQETLESAGVVKEIVVNNCHLKASS